MGFVQVGNGHTGEKGPEKSTQKLQKNDIFFMNESFRGAFGSKIGSNWSKKYAGCNYNIHIQPNPCFWGVLKDFDFHKNPDFFAYFSIAIKKETPMWQGQMAWP